MASPVAQMVKNLPANQETQVWSLGREDPLEKEMATHSSILAWEIPWTEEPAGLESMGLQKSRTRLSEWNNTGPRMCTHTQKGNDFDHNIFVFITTNVN